jgi:F-type H+-transporting ATPase subunit delta
MTNTKVSLRYALSLLETANDKNILDAVSKDMDYVSSVLRSSGQLRAMLGNPVIKPVLKSSVLKELFSNKISNDSLEFIFFLVEKNRIEFLKDIVNKFFELRDEYLGIVNVDVKTALEFTPEQTSVLKKKFEGLLNKKVNFKFEIDKSILGGFVARVGDTVYDASISNQLNLLKKQFAEG